MGKPSPLERIGAEARGVRYDVARRTGQLHMPDGCCCDMQACIDLFQGIDAHVEVIFTYAGARADTIYSRTNGKWSAIPVEDKRPNDGITPGVSEVKDAMAKAALPLSVDPDILTYAALEIAIEGIVDQVDNMYLDVDASDLVANEMFANVFAFLDADDRKREQILITLGEAQGTA
jgi:hypothetical protein